MCIFLIQAAGKKDHLADTPHCCPEGGACKQRQASDRNSFTKWEVLMGKPWEQIWERPL